MPCNPALVRKLAPPAEPLKGKKAALPPWSRLGGSSTDEPVSAYILSHSSFQHPPTSTVARACEIASVSSHRVFESPRRNPLSPSAQSRGPQALLLCSLTRASPPPLAAPFGLSRQHPEAGSSAVSVVSRGLYLHLLPWPRLAISSTSLLSFGPSNPVSRDKDGRARSGDPAAVPETPIQDIHRLFCCALGIRAVSPRSPCASEAEGLFVSHLALLRVFHYVPLTQAITPSSPRLESLPSHERPRRLSSRSAGSWPDLGTPRVEGRLSVGCDEACTATL